METVPVAGPSISQLEVDYVVDAVKNCWYGDANKYHEKFESAFANYIGVRHAIALPSCTSAIHLSLAALGIGSGDEVIVPDVTWIASAAPINYVGARPVFADIDRNNWCLSPEAFSACITTATRAVIVVDLYGNVPDMEGILAIAKTQGIAVIEDAAEAFGSEYAGRKTGCFGDTGVFSFHGSKTMTTGEGGMLVTDRRDIYERALVLRDHGRRPGDVSFCNHEVAFKYKMSSMQAAVGLAQVERAEELVARKRQIFDWYKDELQGVPEVTLNAEPAGTRNSYWMVTAVLSPSLGLRKERLAALLAERGVATRPFFNPLSSLGAYSDLPEAETARLRNTTSYEISPYGINLPSALLLTRDQVTSVCIALRRVIELSRHQCIDRVA